MGGRLRSILSLFSGCYIVTSGIWQSLHFALMPRNRRTSRIKLNDKLSVMLRNNKTDQEGFLAAFLHQYHRSPVDLGKTPVIVDLGSNIGLTIVDFKRQYPLARIIGVEMDKGNFDLCNINIAQFTDCISTHAAIWKENGFISYQGKDEQSYAVEATSFGHKGLVRSIIMDDILKENKITVVDYLKMDIEGSEKAVLLESTAKTWLRKVKYLSIEVHDLPGLNKTILFENLKTDLESNQFQVYKSTLHWSSLFAINKLLVPA
jgi:FkbM family methyltransferase